MTASPRRRLARRDPKSRRRLGRGSVQLQAGLSRLRARALHGVADRLAALALMGGRIGSSALKRGVAYLQRRKRSMGCGRGALHRDRLPRVFYLRYHGYGKFFPLWALAPTAICCARTIGASASGFRTVPDQLNRGISRINRILIHDSRRVKRASPARRRSSPPPRRDYSPN